MAEKPQEPLIGQVGGGYIRKALSISDPKRVIAEIQEDHELHVPSLPHIVPLLDQSGCSRHILHLECLNALKKSLLERINPTLTTQDYDALLDKSLGYLHVPQLREIPLALLALRPTKLSPGATARIINEPDLFALCPMEVKRHIWSEDQALFRDYVLALLKGYQHDTNLLTACGEICPVDSARVLMMRRQHPSVTALVEAIHTNRTLYDVVLRILRSNFLSSGDRVYCAIRFDLLMKMHDKDLPEIYNSDPCYRLAWSLDACMRISMDDRRVHQIQKFFDSVPREDAMYGDIAMILYGHSVYNMFAHQVLQMIRKDCEVQASVQSNSTLRWTATIMKLGTRAQIMIQMRDFKIQRIEKEVTAKFIPALAQVVKGDLEREQARVRRRLEEDKEDEDLGYWSEDEEPEDEDLGRVEHLTDTEIAIIADNSVACSVFNQYILDRCKRLDLYALLQALPVLLATQPLTSHPDSFLSLVQSMVTYLTSELQPLFGKFLTRPRLREVVVTHFFLRCVSESSLVLQQVFRLCNSFLVLLTMSPSAFSNPVTQPNKNDAFRVIIEWMEEACAKGQVHRQDPQAVEACAQVIRQASITVGAAHNVLRNQTHVRQFLEDSSSSATAPMEAV
ncbi:hypothetical protein IWQ62_000265 [Dispira parvispora]|uniref:Uncharacterized protein n=1 Tax=Dispira parvispora TaxID=1520584 RepID=A0A9W8E9U8_9FUNG|nr:hypothetical protein IWQ62_000265 [Dispira parvispora]